MDDRVRRVLVAHLPAHGRTRRRTDEEELVALGQWKVLIAGVHGRVDAEVDADAVAHQGLAVEGLADGDGVGRVEEGDDDALEGFERRPCVDFGVGVDGLADFCQGGGLEDLRCEEVLWCVRQVSCCRFALKLTVMMSVFEGGDGCTRGGRSDRSRESGDLLPDDARERDGEGRLACMLAVAIMCVARRGSVW